MNPASIYKVAQTALSGLAEGGLSALSAPVAIGAVAARSNDLLNRGIIRDAEIFAREDPVLTAIYNDRLSGAKLEDDPDPPVVNPGNGDPGDNDPGDREPGDPDNRDPGDGEPDDPDEHEPFIGDVNRIIERHPPPPGVNVERFREFIETFLRYADRLDVGARAVTSLLQNALLYYHLWTESGLRPPPPPSDDGRKDTVVLPPMRPDSYDPPPPEPLLLRDQKKIESKLMGGGAPLPP